MTLHGSMHYLPQTVSEAVGLLAQAKDGKVLAGGTDLLVNVKQGLYAPGALIGVRALPECCNLAYDPDVGLQLGAAVTLNAVIAAEIIQKHYPVLAAAASNVGSLQLRMMGTVGGNICLDTRCWYINQSDSWVGGLSPCYKRGGDICHVAPRSPDCLAIYCSDMAPALMVLGAQLRVAGRQGIRTIPLDALYTQRGFPHLTLDPGELVTAVLLPPVAPGVRSACAKFSLSSQVAFPAVNAAAALTVAGDVVQAASVCVGAVDSAPIRLGRVEEVLAGQRLDAGAIAKAADLVAYAIRPQPSPQFSPSYRKRLVRWAVGKVLTDISEQVGRGAERW